MEQLAEFVNHIDILVVSNAAGEFAQLSDLKDEVLLDLIQLAANKFESVEMPLLAMLLQVKHLFFEFVQLAHYCGDF